MGYHGEPWLESWWQSWEWKRYGGESTYMDWRMGL